jgi:hypothetical protein
MGSTIAVALLLVGGMAAFWFGLRAFRAQASAQAEATHADDDIAQEIQETDLVHIPAIAVLRSSAGDVGRATRVLSAGSAMLDILVTLPALESTSGEYHVWLVKDGLADVVDVGALTARADGTWTGTFSASPATGIVNPLMYSEIVIMSEPQDGDIGPSGIKAATGTW